MLIPMRKLLIPFAIVSVAVFPKSPLQAGLYLPAVPTQGPEISPQGVKPLPFSLLRRDVLEDLLRIGNPQPPESTVRRQFLKGRDELQAKQRRGPLSQEDQMNLSGYLIRLRQFQEAIDLLTPVATRECRNFMVFANLATAEQQAGHLERAISHLEQAQDVWPSQWPDMTPEQLRWFQQVERYQLRLLRQRWAETRLGKPPAGMDTLFTKDEQPIRYIGDSGHFEAGKIAPAERDKLPADALAILQQLLIWLPDDARLYWQMGELLNAMGDVSSAAIVFDDCVWRRRLDDPELRQHRQIVAEAAQAMSQESVMEDVDGSSGSTPSNDWLPDRNKLWTVGSIFAIIAVVMIYFQFREFRRRRGPTFRK
jgi:tetratricopeptide (TPR) repeat protein